MAGLTKGALYHHFPNKMDLGYAVVDELLAGLLEEVWLAPLAGEGDPIEKLRTLLRTAKLEPEVVVLGCPINNLAVEMAPVDDGFRERIEGLYQRWIDGVADALTRGKRDGFVSKQVDPTETATFIVAAMAGSRGLAKNAQSREKLIGCHRQLERYLETCRAGSV